MAWVRFWAHTVIMIRGALKGLLAEGLARDLPLGCKPLPRALQGSVGGHLLHLKPVKIRPVGRIFSILQFGPPQAKTRKMRKMRNYLSPDEEKQ